MQIVSGLFVSAAFIFISVMCKLKPASIEIYRTSEAWIHKKSDLKMRIILSLVLILILTGCNYRTSSRIRFSEALDIQIPKDVTVTKDEYQDMMQDFVIIYEIQLTEDSYSELIESIKNSNYYNPKAFADANIDPNMYIDYDGKKAVWAKTKNGYLFGNDYSRDSYSAEVDTVNLVAKFVEGHD